MKWLGKLKSDMVDYFFDHPKGKQALHWGWMFFVTVVSCFIFAWGFRAFINPSMECAIQWTIDANTSYEKAKILVEQQGVVHLISGGASGTAQAIVKFINIFGDLRLYEQDIISLLYFGLNIPLIILSWFKISKQFTIFTLLNVGFVSLFNSIIPDEWIYRVINLYDDMIARCIFGGIITGIASGAAMAINTSAGGTDILSFYIAEKRSAAVGNFSFIINGIVLVTNVFFGILGHLTNPIVNPQASNEVIRYALYTFLYMFISTRVIDVLNIKNKKEELQIFTSDETLPQVLIHAFPHSATVVDAKGAFTGQKRLMIHMVLSTSEVKTAVSVVRKADPNAFVTVINLKQVHGRFYIRPIE